MFVTEKSFLELKQLDGPAKNMVAKVVNSIIDREGVVLYGTINTDGSYINFTTENKKNDTHVLMSVAPDQMGLLEPSDKEVKVNPLSDADKIEADRRRLKDVEAELHQLRNLQKQWEKPKPSGGHVV